MEGQDDRVLATVHEIVQDQSFRSVHDMVNVRYQGALETTGMFLPAAVIRSPCMPRRRLHRFDRFTNILKAFAAEWRSRARFHNVKTFHLLGKRAEKHATAFE
jgi:hypothetical protein